MSDYQQLANDARTQVHALTAKTLREIDLIYAEVAAQLAQDTRGSFYAHRTMAMQQEVEAYRKELAKAISGSVTESLTQAADIGAAVNQQAVLEIFAKAGIGVKPSFDDMFGQVKADIVQDIIGGGLYKDNRTLSGRIWTFTRKNQQDLQYVIATGIASGRSAVDLANDLQNYVKRPARRFVDWGKAYPRLNGVSAEYNAMRLARTSINHSYQGSTVKSSMLNPFVHGILWQSDQGHRTCELCLERHGTIYPTDDVPIDHPNGLCVMVPHVPNSFDDIADSLRGWLDGAPNDSLDEWFAKYGEHFAYRSSFDTYNRVKSIRDMLYSMKGMLK